MTNAPQQGIFRNTAVLSKRNYSLRKRRRGYRGQTVYVDAIRWPYENVSGGRRVRRGKEIETERDGLRAVWTHGGQALATMPACMATA
jgi:hypothetical protein